MVEEKLRTRWNVLHAVGAIDGKHIAMKKPKKSGSGPLQLQGLLFPGSPGPGQCRIQIPVERNLREKIEDDSLRLPASEQLGEGGPDLHYFLLDNNAYVLMPWMVKPCSRRQLTREERIANYRISRGRRVVENAFGIFVSWFRVLLGNIEQRPRVSKVSKFF